MGFKSILDCRCDFIHIGIVMYFIFDDFDVVSDFTIGI